MHMVLVPAPHIRERRTVPYFPLGVLSLHQVLSDAGHDCRIYYPLQDAADPAGPEMAIRRWAAEILSTDPRWVGLSTACSTYPLVLLLARAVKQMSPETCVVLGGPQASVTPEESMAAFPWIDYIVRGEAENVVLDLVQAIENGSGPERAASITYRSNSKIVSTALAPLLTDLDSLAPPDYQAYPHYREALLFERPPFEIGFIPVEPGRGCPYRCSFCSSSGFWRRRPRQKSPHLLAEQVEKIVRRHKVKNLFFLQDIFTVDKGWLDDFLCAMEANVKVAWGCYLRADSVDASTLADMKRVGCVDIFFGVDSGSQRSQKLMGKDLEVAQACKIVEAAAENGVGVSTSFIVGFPWETRQDLQDTLSLHRHFLSVGVERSRIGLLTPLPKTEVTTRYASRLRINDTQSGMWRTMAGFRNAEMSQMIRNYPQIFSNFYYVEPECVSYEEFRVAAWSANALSGASRGGAY